MPQSVRYLRPAGILEAKMTQIEIKPRKRRLLTRLEYSMLMNVTTSAVDAWVRNGKVEPFRTPSGYPRFLAPDWVPEDQLPDA